MITGFNLRGLDEIDRIGIYGLEQVGKGDADCDIYGRDLNGNVYRLWSDHLTMNLQRSIPRMSAREFGRRYPHPVRACDLDQRHWADDSPTLRRTRIELRQYCPEVATVLSHRLGQPIDEVRALMHANCGVTDILIAMLT